MVTSTTIKVKISTKEELDKLKIHPRETYEDVLFRLIKIHIGGINGKT